jgi:hypothetical protein
MPRPFEGPINIDPPVTKTREVRCLCSPFCQGASSHDWATCVAGCNACRPPPWQPPTRTPALGGPIIAADPS